MSRSNAVWAEDTSMPLKQLGYKYLRGEVLGETIKRGKPEALVVMRSKIYTVIGKFEQTEAYLLSLVKEKWLIDEVIVGDEIEDSVGEWGIEM